MSKTTRLDSQAQPNPDDEDSLAATEPLAVESIGAEENLLHSDTSDTACAAEPADSGSAPRPQFRSLSEVGCELEEQRQAATKLTTAQLAQAQLAARDMAREVPLNSRREWQIRLPAGIVKSLVLGALIPLLSWTFTQVISLTTLILWRQNPWVVESSWATAFKEGARLWQAINGGGYTWNEDEITLWPTGFMVFFFVVAWLILRVGLRRKLKAAWWAWLGTVPVAAVLSTAAQGGALGWKTVLGASLSVALAGMSVSFTVYRPRMAAGWKRGFDRAWVVATPGDSDSDLPSDSDEEAPCKDTVEAWFWAVPRSVLAVFTPLIGLSLGICTTLYVMHYEQVVQLRELLQLGGFDRVVLALIQLGFVPTFAAWALAWFSRGGFYFGVDSLFGPDSVGQGPIVAVPVLGALPQSPSQWWMTAVVIALGVVAGIWWHYRAGRYEYIAQLKLMVATTVVVIPVMVWWLWSATGALGKQRLAVIGPQISPSLGLLILQYLIPCLVVMALIHPVARQTFSTWSGFGKGRTKRSLRHGVASGEANQADTLAVEQVASAGSDSVLTTQEISAVEKPGEGGEGAETGLPRISEGSAAADQTDTEAVATVAPPLPWPQRRAHKIDLRQGRPMPADSNPRPEEQL